MSVFLYLVRHAQGEHNLSKDGVILPDPSLTPLGISQCAALRASFPHHAQLTHLIASPMRRTIQTCLHAFVPTPTPTPTPTPAAARNLRITLLPKLQEIGPWPCDTGSAAAALEAEFGAARIDVAQVRREEPAWTDKKAARNLHAADFARIEQRALAARRELQQVARGWRAEKGEAVAGVDAHMAVVSHGAFLHFLSECFYEIPRSGTTWTNAAYRTFAFTDSTLRDTNATMMETDESWKARHGDKPRPTTEETKILREAYKTLLAPYLSEAWRTRK